MKRKRLIKLEKQYFSVHNGNPFDSKSLCTSEIVRSANRIAIETDVIILSVKEPSWSIGRVNIYTKATKTNYESINVASDYLAERNNMYAKPSMTEEERNRYTLGFRKLGN